VKRQALEKIEVEKFNKEKIGKQKAKTDTLEKKQDNERKTLKKKLEIEFDVQKNQRTADYDKLVTPNN
jgi:hypothetical protein